MAATSFVSVYAVFLIQHILTFTQGARAPVTHNWRRHCSTHCSVSLAYQIYIFCQKASFFCTFYSQLFNEMFVFGGKSRCCNGTFATYIAGSKEYLTRRQLFLDV